MNQEAILMATWSEKKFPLPDKKDVMKFKEFMRQKFDMKKFGADEDAEDDEDSSEDEEEAEKRRRRKKKKAAAAKKAAEAEAMT